MDNGEWGKGEAEMGSAGGQYIEIMFPVALLEKTNHLSKKRDLVQKNKWAFPNCAYSIVPSLAFTF